jgi:hypothetical protein
VNEVAKRIKVNANTSEIGAFMAELAADEDDDEGFGCEGDERKRLSLIGGESIVKRSSRSGKRLLLRQVQDGCETKTVEKRRLWRFRR